MTSVAPQRSGTGGQHDAKKPWYMRRRLWLATVSLLYVGWRRVRALGRSTDDQNRHNVAA